MDTDTHTHTRPEMVGYLQGASGSGDEKSTSAGSETNFQSFQRWHRLNWRSWGQNQVWHLRSCATLIGVVTFVESIVSVRPTAVTVCVSVLFRNEKPQGRKLDRAPRRAAEDKNQTAQDRPTFTADLKSVFLSQHTHAHETSWKCTYYFRSCQLEVIGDVQIILYAQARWKISPKSALFDLNPNLISSSFYPLIRTKSHATFH